LKILMYSMKRFLFICLFALSTAAASSQEIHDVGVSAIDFAAGKSGIGFTGRVAMMKNTSPSFYLKLQAAGDFGRLYNLRYQLYSFDVLGYVKPFYISEFFQLNIGGGLTAGYEHINNLPEENAKNIGFSAGIKGSVEAEVFLNDQVGAFLYGDQSLLLKKSLGKNRYGLGVGIRIFLNNYR